MKNIFLQLIIFFIITGCSTVSWNTPFINSENIVKLEFGMTKEDVLRIMPEAPLYVESGNSETSVWVYNVRTIKVQSAKNFYNEITAQKTDEKIKHQPKINDLYLTFDIKDNLLAWGNKAYDPNYIEPYYDCSGVCNGNAYIDECGECTDDSKLDNNTNIDDTESFKLQLNVEGTKKADGSFIIEGGQ